MTRFLGFALGALLVGACASPADSAAYQHGSLNNGAFLFACDDSVACARWNHNAAVFPTAITTGSNFDIYFVASQDIGNISATLDPEYPGMTLEAVGPYVGHGPDGFAALQPGYGTILAHDRDGNVIDYLTLHIVKPDDLVVYDAAYSGDNPPPVTSLSLATNDRKSFRTVGETKLEPTAGSIRVEWTSGDPKVVVVESYAQGVVTIRAAGPGTTSLTASGAALTKTIAVEVK